MGILQQSSEEVMLHLSQQLKKEHTKTEQEVIVTYVK